MVGTLKRDWGPMWVSSYSFLSMLWFLSRVCTQTLIPGQEAGSREPGLWLPVPLRCKLTSLGENPDPWSPSSGKSHCLSRGPVGMSGREGPAQLVPHTVFFQFHTSFSMGLWLGESTPPEPSSISAIQANIKFEVIWRLIMQ